MQNTPYSWLARLADTVGVSVGAPVARFLDGFGPHLRHFQELGLAIRPTSIAVVTLGCGRAFGEQVATYLTEVGFPREKAMRVLELQASIDPWMLVRVLADDAPVPEVGIYFRKSMPVNDAVRWLASHDVNLVEQEALQTLSKLVGGDRTGIFAARFSVDEPVFYRAYIHAYADASRSVANRLRPVFEHFRVADPRWRSLLNGLDRLGEPAPADVYVSLMLGDGDAFDSVKLDIFQVDLVAFERLLTEVGLLDPHEPSPVRVGQELRLRTAEHCGLRFAQDGTGLTFYFVPPSEP